MTPPSIPLSDGTSIPQLGFGVFQIPEEDTAEAVRHALQTGYRHVDTAKVYGNEKQVGEAVRECDDHVYVTTKLWNDDQGTDSARAAFEASFERLGLDHIDLYLIHWPIAMAGRFVDTWKTLIELREDDRLRSIGVSNFTAGQPRHAGRRDRRRPRHQPDRAAPVPPAEGAARVPRRARHRHGGVVADRPGRGARRPGPQGDRRRPTASRRARSRCAGTSSSAT